MASALTTTEIDIAPVIDAVRSGSPLVHCITNTVVTNFTANALLAAGASPAMVDAPQESGILASVAGALLINLGTVTSAQAEGMRMAIAGANVAGVPWVLDPVAIGALPMRTALAREFAALEPAVIRGNASEIGALAGGSGGRGVDSTATTDDVADVAAEVARQYNTVVAMSGAVDLITDGTRTVRVASGSPMLTRVTGVGCALGALIGACLAVHDDRVLAAAAATSWVCVAGAEAARTTSAIGTFAVAFLDGLDLLSGQDISARAELGAG
jgi:hydroxyethylthiazole kinase